MKFWIFFHLFLAVCVENVDSPNSSGSKVTESSCMTKELEKVVEELPANTFEDQPLSKWFQMNSPTTNDASSKLRVLSFFFSAVS